jgi:hypothetical protein
MEDQEPQEIKIQRPKRMELTAEESCMRMEAFGERKAAIIASVRKAKSRDAETVLNQLLAEMQRLDALMQSDRLEIARLKAETRLLRAEAARLEAESRDTLARLKAMFPGEETNERNLQQITT